MDPGLLMRCRRALMREREAQLARIEALRDAGMGDSLQETSRELSSYDQHPADQGTETFEREKDLGLLASAKDVLERVEAALRRMETGEYGICQGCGEVIDPARLEALPYASRCVDCEEMAEQGRDRWIERATRRLDFSHAFPDGTDEAGYDGEDAWREVARYGTANSPQDLPGADDFDLAPQDIDDGDGRG